MLINNMEITNNIFTCYDDKKFTDYYVFTHVVLDNWSDNLNPQVYNALIHNKIISRNDKVMISHIKTNDTKLVNISVTYNVNHVPKIRPTKEQIIKELNKIKSADNNINITYDGEKFLMYNTIANTGHE